MSTNTWELYDQLHAERVRAEIETASVQIESAVYDVLGWLEEDGLTLTGLARTQLADTLDNAHTRLANALDLLP